MFVCNSDVKKLRKNNHVSICCIVLFLNQIKKKNIGTIWQKIVGCSLLKRFKELVYWNSIILTKECHYGQDKDILFKWLTLHVIVNVLFSFIAERLT